jgi:hypothetical protein
VGVHHLKRSVRGAVDVEDDWTRELLQDLVVDVPAQDERGPHDDRALIGVLHGKRRRDRGASAPQDRIGTRDQV